MSQLASIALMTARTLLNDDGIQLWTDVALLPKLQLAHRELQAQLRAAACPVTRNIHYSVVTAGSLVLTDTTLTDLVEPITLWENAVGGTEDSYVRMTEYDPLPISPQASRLIYWRWGQEQILFIGCSVDRSVKIYYKRELPIPASGNDPIGMIDGEFYIAPRIAALTFGSTGNVEASAWCKQMADATINDIIISNRGRSKMVPRP